MPRWPSLGAWRVLEGREVGGSVEASEGGWRGVGWNTNKEVSHSFFWDLKRASELPTPNPPQQHSLQLSGSQ